MINMLLMALFFTLLIILFCICYITSYKKILLSPQMGMIIGFIISVGYGFLWYNKWGFQPSIVSFLVLIGGITFFVLLSIIVQYIALKYRVVLDRSKIYRRDGNRSNEICINKFKIIFFLFIQIVSLLWSVFFVIKLSNNGFGSAIYYLRYYNLILDEEITLPILLKIFRTLSIAGVFFWGYLLIHSIIYKYKTYKLLYLCSVLLGVVNGMILSGGRAVLFNAIISLFVDGYFLYGTKTNWNYNIKFKSFIKYGILALLIIIFFPLIGKLLGRNFDNGFFEYIATYISAELYNFDSFVRSSNSNYGSSFYNCKTLIYVVNFFSGKFGLPNWYHKAEFPSRTVNGYNTGNLHTVFYNFLFDDGYFGVVFFTGLMAIISQLFYISSVKIKNESKVSITLMVYSYQFYGILFSFFSCRFYEMIFAPGFIYMLISWTMLKLYIEKFDFKVSKRIM